MELLFLPFPSSQGLELGQCHSCTDSEVMAAALSPSAFVETPCALLKGCHSRGELLLFLRFSHKGCEGGIALPQFCLKFGFSLTLRCIKNVSGFLSPWMRWLSEPLGNQLGALLTLPPLPFLLLSFKGFKS